MVVSPQARTQPQFQSPQVQSNHRKRVSWKRKTIPPKQSISNISSNNNNSHDCIVARSCTNHNNSVVDEQQQLLLQLINNARVLLWNLPPLVQSKSLTALAQMQAQYMAKHSHGHAGRVEPAMSLSQEELQELLQSEHVAEHVQQCSRPTSTTNNNNHASSSTTPPMTPTTAAVLFWEGLRHHHSSSSLSSSSLLSKIKCSDYNEIGIGLAVKNIHEDATTTGQVVYTMCQLFRQR